MLSRAPILPAELQRRVEAELQSGETLAWAEQPLRFYRVQAIALALFGIPWTAFAVFWVYAAAGGLNNFLGSKPPILFALFGVPFILIGIGMLSSPIWKIGRAHV